MKPLCVASAFTGPTLGLPAAVGPDPGAGAEDPTTAVWSGSVPVSATSDLAPIRAPWNRISAAWIGRFEEALIDFLPDDEIAVGAFDDLLDRGSFVAGGDQELRRVFADRFVFADGQRKPLAAFDIRALADESDLLPRCGTEVDADVADALVDLTKERFVLRLSLPARHSPEQYLPRRPAERLAAARPVMRHRIVFLYEVRLLRHPEALLARNHEFTLDQLVVGRDQEAPAALGPHLAIRVECQQQNLRAARIGTFTQTRHGIAGIDQRSGAFALLLVCGTKCLLVRQATAVAAYARLSPRSRL
jgi:hypothetical protein